MLNEFTKGELKNLFTGPEEGQEAAVLDQGTGITGGEAAVEAEVDMNVNVIVVGTGILVTGAGAGLEAAAAVGVLVIAENVVEANMMMSGGDEAGLMEVLLLLDEVLVLGEAQLQTNHLLPGVKVQMFVITKIGHLPLRVSLLAAVAILGVHLHVLRLKNEGWYRCWMDFATLLFVAAYAFSSNLIYLVILYVVVHMSDFAEIIAN